MAPISQKVLCTVFLVFTIKFTNGLDILTPSRSMRDGETLVSPDGTFELGFFRPAAGISNNTYLGIWYKLLPVRTVVWVANRVSPINDSSGVLMVDSQANLLLLSQNNTIVWSTNSTVRAQVINPLVQLLDTGNLVVVRDQKDVDSGNYLWQSFDYPTDTLLPGMKLGWDLTTGLNKSLTSWKSRDDPAPGGFVWRIAFQNFPEGVVWRGSQKFYRSGPWDGVGFSGAPEMRTNPVAAFSFVSNETRAYIAYTNKNESIISRMVMNQTSSNLEVHAWNEASQSWALTASAPRDRCDSYALCGPHGNCLVNDTLRCQCLNNFKPKSPDKWNSQEWTQGCERNKPLDCPNDGFIKFEGLKLPDATYSWVNRTMNLDECKVKCLQNCKCTAYTSSDISGEDGSGCAIWFGDLTDIREQAAGGQDLYIRMHRSEVESSNKHKHKLSVTVIILAVLGCACGPILAACFIWRAHLKNKELEKKNNVRNNDEQRGNMELPIIEFTALSNATDNFSIKNKLGEGYFGPVYRGTLENDQEIAVKLLSKSPEQGLNEFNVEFTLISKLQHKNLVRILACCIHEEKRILVYEYMPNKSLDFFIFDRTRSRLLDWPKRFNIICGIARGLLYLHQDSILRIIHGDLKANNVLLDNELNPKISHFGYARSLEGDQAEGSTRRGVGTDDYIAPEYAANGILSEKSDVFSFGILVLEILSGRSSRGFYHPDQSLSLIGHAWSMWKERKPFELIDLSSENSTNLSEVLRCINISLLCVQEDPGDRPNMASVVWMLGGDSALPLPKEPGYFKDRSSVGSSFASSESGSIDEIRLISNSILESQIDIELV